MFSILDTATRLCDGISRRELLRVGGLSAVGLSLPQLLRAAPSANVDAVDDPTFGRAKSVIYVWLQGGPPQHETFDPKPEAPLEIRGPFSPIQTNVSGIEFCELLPRTARIADKLAVVRSIHTNTELHDASGYELLTGYKYRGANSRMISPDDWPYFGSIVKMLKPSEKLPALTTAWIPDIMRLNENVTPAGQTGGFLGRQWDPDRFVGDPSAANYHIEGIDSGGISPLRMRQRVALLKQVEEHLAGQIRSRPEGIYDQFQGQAFDLLTSGKARKAFSLDEERPEVRDRYGRTKWGQCLLLARRLVEAGVRLVHVNWAREPGDSAVDNPMWDTHAQNADRVEDVLCPMFDVGFTAFIRDLDERGLLAETLVVAIGEFGRTPRINSVAGRDHWGNVFSFLMAGAGIQAGQVYGSSDKNGAYPARDPVTGGDLTATIMHLLGIPHSGTFQDSQGRPHTISMGAPIRQILGSGTAAAGLAIPGGDIARVPPFNDALLLNPEFSNPVPLQPTNIGSRPKGWRATPLADGDGSRSLGVRLQHDQKRHVAIGYGIDGIGIDTVHIEADAQAILAQEIRNPRLGRFRFTVEACGHATSAEYYESVFLKNLRCRIIIYRYNKPTKDPAGRTEFVSTIIEPAFSDAQAPKLQEFSVETLLDSPAPGQNFPIGNGYGVAVSLENATGRAIELAKGSSPHRAWIRVDGARLEFSDRTVNDKVKV